MSKASTDSVESIAVGKFHPDPEQPRKHFDEKSLQELADSINAQKLLYPILYREVVENEETKFIIVDGERRWRAYQKLGLKEIPAMKFEGDHEAVALIGNIVREDLTAMEEAIAVNKLKSKVGKKATNVDIGKLLGKAESTISETLSLLKLPDSIQQEVLKNKEWSRTKLGILAKKHKGSEAQKRLFERMKKEILQEKSKRGPKKDKIVTAQKHISNFKSSLDKLVAYPKWSASDKSELKDSLKDLSKAIADMLKGL